VEDNMEFVDLEKIYKFYKNEIKILKLLYENKRFKFVTTCLLFIGWVILYFIWLGTKNNDFLYIGIVIYILSLVLVFFLGGDTINIIKESYNIKSEKNSLDSALVIARSGLLLDYLYKGEYNFKLKKQKETLIAIFEEESQSSKFKKFWIMGIAATLLVPVWSAFVNSLINSNRAVNDLSISEIIVIIFFILLSILFLKASIFDNIVSLKNRRSKAFKEMANIIRNDLLFNEYSKENSLKGEIYIKKI
jgi:hypothetical protein